MLFTVYAILVVVFAVAAFADFALFLGWFHSAALSFWAGFPLLVGASFAFAVACAWVLSRRLPRLAVSLCRLLRRCRVLRAAVVAAVFAAVLLSAPSSAWAPLGVARVSFSGDSWSGGPGIACDSFVVQVRPAGAPWAVLVESYDSSDGPSQSAHWLSVAAARGFVPVRQ